MGIIRTRLSKLTKQFLRPPLPASVSDQTHDRRLLKPASLLAFFVAFATVSAASYGLLIRRAEPALVSPGNVMLTESEATPEESTLEFTQRGSSDSNASAADSFRHKSTVEQELTVNGQAIPIPKNRKVQHVIPAPGGNINVTIDNRQSSTSTSSSQSTNLSTEVHITQEGGVQD